MKFRLLGLSLLPLFVSAANVSAAEPKLTFYLPFDGNTTASVAGGNKQGKFGAGATPQFTPGLSGQGFLTGADNQNITFDASKNISPNQWTITFWVKGLPGAQWNGGKHFQTFWQLDGEQGEIMWFYHYMDKTNPWLLAQPKAGQGDTVTMFVPAVPEEQWHQWAASWRKGIGAYIYLDGRLVGQSPCKSPSPVKNITIGQAANPYSPAAPNKIIDEFKIYDTALDSGAIARHYWQEGNFALQPTLTVAPTKSKITVDGKIDVAEWKDAAGITGFLDRKNWNLATPPTWARMTYDSQNLYLALNSGKDDSFVLQFMPQPSTGKLYDLVVDEAGKISGTEQANGAAAKLPWLPPARLKRVLTANGRSVEIALPLKSFDLAGLADGETWRINLGRVSKSQPQRNATWAAGRRDGDSTAPFASAAVSFFRKPAAVSNLRNFSIAPDGRISATLDLHNPGTQPRELNVRLSAAAKVLQQRKVSLQPGGRQTISLAEVSQDADGGLGEITVQSGETVLLRQAAPLILKRVGQLTLWSYPSLGQVRLGWVIQSVSDPTTLSLHIQMKNAAGNVVQKAAVNRLASFNGSTLIDIKSLPAGKYALETQIKAGQSVLQQQSIVYDKLPLPSWLGNSLGVSDTPPPPWTDVQVARDKDTVSLWGRTYDFAGHLLPRQIVNQGKGMLAAPMQLTVQAENEAAQSSASARAAHEWTKATAARADFVRTQALGPVALKSNSYVEYDGMTWMNLTVTPTKTQANLKRLTLEVPLKAEWASLIKPSDDYKMGQTGPLPEKGWSGKGSSMPWVGNGDGGIQFFQETTATWVGSKTVEAVPDGKGAVVLRLHLIDAPMTLSKPLTFALGWIASPVKATPKNHRDWVALSPGPFDSDPAGTQPIATYMRGAAATNRDIKPYFLWWQEWWWLPEAFDGNSDETGLLPVPAPGNTARKNAVREYSGTKFYGAPYGRLTQMGTANPWFAQFGDEWVRSTSKFTPNLSVAAARQLASVSQASDSLRDFYLWGYNQLFNEGNVHALYFDESHPIFDENIYHGAGTLRPDGSVEPKRNILGTRRTLQRIYTLLKAKRPDAKIFIHMSGDVVLPVDSFADGLIDGENYYWLLDRDQNRGYEKVLSLDQFRTEFSAQNNLGPASIFLPQFQNVNSISAGEWKTLGLQPADYLLGLTFLHDSKLWWAYMPFDHLALVHSAFDATGLNSQWSFTPYWRENEISLPEGVHGSIYHSPDRNKAVLVLMNTSGKDQEMSLPLILGKDSYNSAKAVYPDRPVTVRDGKVDTLRIENNRFISLVLEK